MLVNASPRHFWANMFQGGNTAIVDLLVKLCPIFLMFVVGSLLRWCVVVHKRDAALLLKLVFFIALPALILLSLSDISISATLMCLPCIAGVTILTTYGASFGVCYLLKQRKPVAGVVLIGLMVMNVGFLYPFLLSIYGSTGFVQAVIFDIGNIVVVYTFVYYIACRYGHPSESSGVLLGKVLTAPPVWAIAEEC